MRSEVRIAEFKSKLSRYLRSAQAGHEIVDRIGIHVGEDQSIIAPHEEIRGTVDLLHREGGVERSHILPFNTDGALLLEVFTHDGIGTMVVDEKLESLREATADDVGGILQLIEPFEKDGTLPNTIFGEDASNRDTVDAPLWFGVVCEELAAAEAGAAALSFLPLNQPNMSAPECDRADR